MVIEDGQPDMYWTGGPARVSIECPNEFPKESVSEAIAILEEFRSESQKLYFSFLCATEGLRQQRKLYEQFITSETMDNMISVGGRPPDQEQVPGLSTVAQMRQGELLESLAAAGTFENYQARVLVVTIYHLWDDYYRDEIRKVLSVEKNQVKCALMGDIREVRHLIIHKKSIVPKNLSEGLEFLPQIWKLEPGDLKITGAMVSSLIEQLKAIFVKVDSS